MTQRTLPGDSSDDAPGSASGLSSRAASVASGLEDAVRGVSFWSAIVLPFVVVALLVFQPPGWLPALAVVVAVDVTALYVGHCHDLEC
jgi:hypothetical protein